MPIHLSFPAHNLPLLFPGNELFLLRSCELLYRPLAPLRLDLVIELFIVDELDRPARPRVLGALARVVHLHAALWVSRPARVERAVSAFQDIYIMFLSFIQYCFSRMSVYDNGDGSRCHISCTISSSTSGLA